MGQRILGGLLLVAAIPGQAADRQPGPADPVFVALYERGPAFATGKDVPEQPHFRQHVDHLLGRQDWLIGGGPFPSRSADQAVGLVAFQAVDAADAERWASSDPAVVAGVFKVVVREWMVAHVRPFDRKQE